MSNFRGVRLFGLVACLAVALVLVGVSQLDAKKPPKPPEVQWSAAIPDATTAAGNCIAIDEENYAECNLYGNGTPDQFGYVTFENNGAVEVDVFTNVDPETGPYTVFTLTIAEPGSIGFQNLDFLGCRTYCGEDEFNLCLCEGDCLCQYFPPAEAGSDCCPNDLITGERVCCSRNTPGCQATGYIAMKQFMEDNDHPYTDLEDPEADYEHFSLRFIVDVDIETIGESWKGNADLVRLNLWNTDEILVDADDYYHNDYHNIVCAHWIPLEDVVVERTGADEWTVTVDQCGKEGTENCPANDYGNSEQWVVFWETYYQGILKPIGKSGKNSLDSEYRWARASATPFKFITKWTRN